MNGFLLDTNVLSELMRPKPEAKIVEFVRSHPALWISMISLHEIAFGLLRLPPGQRRQKLNETLENMQALHAERILPIGSASAEKAAQFRHEAQQQGKVCHLADALIAATASTHNLTLATRNVCDFQHLTLHLVNPWI